MIAYKNFIWRMNNPEKMKANATRAKMKAAAKIQAANEILKWAREQGVYNG